MEMGFVFKKVLRLGVNKKVFEWLAAKEFLSNSKNYLRFSCISISCYSIFSVNFFLYYWRFWTTQHEKDTFNQIIRKWTSIGVFVDLLEKYLGMNAGLWSSTCVWFWIFENFCRIFDMYEFSAAIFIKVLSYQSFDVKCLLISWDAIDMWENGKKLVAYGFYSW